MATFFDSGFNDFANAAGPSLSGFTLFPPGGGDALALLADSIGDTFLGGSGDDAVFAGNGNDRIVGGLDIDNCNGGGGNDTIVIDNGNYIDHVNGGTGIDTLDMSVVAANGAFIDLEAGRWKLFLPPSLTDVAIASIEVFLCGSQNDSFIGMTASGNERIEAAGGNDLVNAGGGIDTILGGAGNDYLAGGRDVDIVLGGDGNDTIEMLRGEAADRIAGQAGVDLLDLGSVLATSAIDLTAQTWSITNFGAGNSITGIENVRGGLRTDNIIGSAGANSIDGGGGGDRLDGQGGADVLSGGAGNDLIFGGLGRDTMWGGANRDFFIFRTDGEIVGDVIADFTHGADTIGLAAIDAIAGGADDAFTLTGAFTGTAGELRLKTDGTDIFAAGDTDGDAVADFVIRLWGVIPLTAVDFDL